MRWIILSLIPFAFWLIGRAYAEYVIHRIEENEAFVGLLVYMRGRISCFLSPCGELLSGFCSPALRRVGFLDPIPEGETLEEAYRVREKRLSVGREVRGVLSSFFSDFGHGYREDMLRRIDQAEKELREIAEREDGEMKKSLKLTRSILLLFAVGIVILLI